MNQIFPMTLTVTVNSPIALAVVSAKLVEAERLAAEADLSDTELSTGEQITEATAADKPAGKRTRKGKCDVETVPVNKDIALVDTTATATSTTTEAAAEPAKEPEPQPTAAPTLQEVRDALQLVVDAHGMDGARAFILKQGYERATAIPEDKYASFIDACKAEAGRKAA